MSTPYDLETSDPGGLNLRPRRKVTQLNTRAYFLFAAIGLVLLGAIVYTLSNPTQIAGPVAASANSDAAMDRHWSSQGDGVSMPEVSAPPPDFAATPNGPAVPPSTAAGLDKDEEERRARLKRAVQSSGAVASFATLASHTPTGSAAPGRSTAATHPAVAGLDAIADSLADTDPTLLQNNQAGKNNFLADQTLAVEEETNPNVLRQPISEFEVNAGMVIPAVLLTKGDSDLPGMMTARVRENIYDDATGKHLLVPQGTRLVGVYDSVITFGQRRLLVAWQRMIYPDGSKLNIGSMPGTDLAGAAGFRDKVNRHYHRVFGSALLLSAITAGVTLSQDDDSGSGFGDERSTSQRVQDTLATALGQNLGEVANEMIRREMNVQPTLEIRPGYRFNVFVSKDLIFEGPYLNTFAGGLVP